MKKRVRIWVFVTIAIVVIAITISVIIVKMKTNEKPSKAYYLNQLSRNITSEQECLNY